MFIWICDSDVRATLLSHVGHPHVKSEAGAFKEGDPERFHFNFSHAAIRLCVSEIGQHTASRSNTQCMHCVCVRHHATEGFLRGVSEVLRTLRLLSKRGLCNNLMLYHSSQKLNTCVCVCVCIQWSIKLSLWSGTSCCHVGFWVKISEWWLLQCVVCIATHTVGMNVRVCVCVH